MSFGIRFASTLAARAGRLQPIASPSLRVSELFTSVQGEGPFSGRPSVFLRLGRCNLECVWCDTKFTWLFDEGQLKRIRESVPEDVQTAVGTTVYQKDIELSKLSVTEVVERIVTMATDNKNVQSVVITGGEPLLHKKALLELVPALNEKGLAVEIETNGTISPHGLPASTHYNVSAKLASSYQPQSKRIQLPVLKEFYGLASVLKFVVSTEEDLAEIADIVKATKFPPSRVFLMPEGITPEAVQSRGKWVVDKCLATGYQYSHRVHVSLWGDKRGV